MSMLRSIYRRPCVDHESLRNPVELWLAAGGRFNRMRRRRISAPAELLPRWRAGVEALDLEPAVRDIFLIGFYTGMRRGEIVSLRWERIDLDRRTLRVEETKTGEPLELPITRQLAAIFERRLADIEGPAAQPDGWVFPSSKSGTGHVAGVGHFHNATAGVKWHEIGQLENAAITGWTKAVPWPQAAKKTMYQGDAEEDVWKEPASSFRPSTCIFGTALTHNGISEAGGAKFWFHGLRNAFITVAERELMLPRSLTKRLVNHARPPDVTEGYAADWTVDQLREPAQRLADRIDELMQGSEVGLQLTAA